MKPQLPSCELITPGDAASWAAYHDIRRRILFEKRGRFGVYDPEAPGERNPQNFPKLLVCDSKYVGVVRIDFEGDTAFLRRVAIDEPYQRQGFGRALIANAEAFARGCGATRIESSVAADAVTFYEKCGYQRLSSAGPSVKMCKSLSA